MSRTFTKRTAALVAVVAVVVVAVTAGVLAVTLGGSSDDATDTTATSGATDGRPAECDETTVATAVGGRADEPVTDTGGAPGRLTPEEREELINRTERGFTGGEGGEPPDCSPAPESDPEPTEEDGS